MTRFGLPVAVVVAALLVIHVSIASMWLTGDEPLYVSQGLGIFTHGTLHSDAATWNAFVAKSALRADAYPYAAVNGKQPPALGPSVVFGLTLRFLGLDAARWLNFVIGAAGLFALYALLRKRSPNHDEPSGFVVAFSIATVAFALPFVEYARLLYPEILIFTTVAFALLALGADRRTLAIAAAALLPFEHVRALPLSIALAVTALLDAGARGHGKRRCLGDLALYVTLLFAWAVVQLRTYGSLAGPAFSAHAPSLATLAPRLALQLYDVRHGLIAYAPVYLFGFAGLFAGTRARDPLCTRACALLGIYVLTFVWSSANESWTARFWVAALPMLAIGLAYWLANARTWPAIGALAACCAVTLTNTIVYCLHPMWFVQNRTTSISYAEIASFAHLRIGPAFFPIDDESANVVRLTMLLVATALAVAGLARLAPSRRALER